MFHWPTQWSSSSSASTTVGSTPVGVCQILDSLGYWYTQICFMSVKNLALAQEWAIYFTPRARLDRPRAYRGWGGREVNLPEQFSLCFFSHKLQRQLWINEGRQPSAKNMPRSPSSQWLRRPAIASVVLPRTTTLDSRRLRLERVNCSVTAASWVRRRTGQQCTISRQT